MITDRMSEDADWKEGMNQFRLKMWEELTHLQGEINKLKQQTKENTP